MTLHISCDFCGCELTQPGALIFGPPNDRGETLKRHACVSCWEADGAAAERDRRVGAAVMRALNDCASDDGLSPIDSVMRFVETYSDEDNDPNGDVWAVFDAIRSALGKEAGR